MRVLEYEQQHLELMQKWIVESYEKIMRQEFYAVSYTHLRAHETVLDIVCRLLLEKKKNQKT